MRFGRNPDGRGTRLQQERGAIMIMAAVGAVVAVIAAALSIDIGAQALKRRDLQKVADLAAIDATYTLTELEFPIVGEDLWLFESDAYDQAAASIRRNGLDPASVTRFDVEVGWFNDGSSGGPMFELLDPLMDLDDREFYPCVEINDRLLDAGLLGAALGFLDLPDLVAGCTPNAVRVTLADDVTRYFDILSSSSPVTEVSAVAKLSNRADAEPVEPPDEPGDPPPPGGDDDPADEAYTTVSVGSFLLRLEHDPNPLLTAILEEFVGADATSLRAEAVSYSGLAGATVTLDSLVAGFNNVGVSVGSVDAMLDAEVTVAELLAATAHAVSGDTAASAAVQVFDQEFSESMRGRTIRLRQVVNVAAGLGDAGTQEGGAARVNALHAVLGAVMLATGDNAVTVDVSGRAPGVVPASLGDVVATVRVIEPPQQAVGGEGTVARTGQVRMTVTYRPPSSLLSLLTSRPRLRYDVELAGAEAEILELCVTDRVLLEGRTSYVSADGGNPVGAVITSLDADGDTLPDSALLRGLNSGQLALTLPGNPGETAAFGPDGNFAYGSLWTVWGWPSGVTSPFQSTIENLGLNLTLLGISLNQLIGELQGIVDMTANDLSQLTGLLAGGADVTAYAPHCPELEDPGDDDGDPPTTTTIPGDGSGTASADRIPILVK